MTKLDIFLARIAIATAHRRGLYWLALFCIMRMSPVGVRRLNLEINRVKRMGL